ncbi:MAG TPA: single-stranded-DNA-specific exonuclease RecJ [Methanobacteriaceae archaeon]|nr:single-stranded-DNA-specific exonuclease RecJ [Methanobacteriaceae archaeon]
MNTQALVNVLPTTLERSFKKAQFMVENAEDVKIFTHIDCDGISAGAILSSTLDQLEIDHEIEFISLDKIPDLKVENELTIFSDLGSGQKLDHFSTSNSKVLILDHHPPLRKIGADWKGEFLEINPHYYGIDGSYHVSGGGMTYFLAKTFGFNDLSWIGILSAVGDMQNSHSGKLEGLNQLILADSISKELVQPINDLSIYGRQTRPIYVALSYFGDVKLPITNNRTECIELLKRLNIRRKIGKTPRTLSDLNQDEKIRLFSELVRMLSLEVPSKYAKYVPRLVSGDSYEFLEEKRYTPLRDASEFSTAINACSRHDKPEIAFKVLKGNRKMALTDMGHLAQDHRRYLAQQMEWIQEESRIKSLQNLQYFDGNGIKSNVIGTIAGMILSYGDWKKPMIAFTELEDEKNGLKVSLRCSRLLAYDGIHFGNLIKEVASKVGGTGGGHSVACGAYIPTQNKDNFLKIFNARLNGKI